MGKDSSRIRASIRQRQAAAVPLRVAASLVYFQLHRSVAPRSDDELERALNDAALALAQVGEVYYEDEGRIARIPDDDLRSGLFSGGAKEFTSSAGRRFGALSMRRIDVMRAMDVLEKASEKFLLGDRTVEPLASGGKK